MALRLVEPQTEWLLTLDEVKAALALDLDDQDAAIDDLLTSYMKAAQGVIEAQTQRRYCAQTLEWVLDGLAPMTLPVAPGGDCSKIAVTGVTYADFNTGAPLALDPSLYWVRPRGRTVSIVPRRFAIWPLVGDAAEPVVVAISITSTAADAAPEVGTAMRLLVAHYFKHREAVVGVDARDSSTPLPLGVEDALTGERWS